MRRGRSIFLALLVACAAAPGCGRDARDDGAGAVDTGLRADCEAVGARLVELAGPRVESLSGRDRELMTSLTGQVERQFVTRCQDDAWPAETRRCLREAATAEAFDHCAHDLAPGDDPGGSGR